MTLGHAPDGDRIPPCGFNQDIPRLLSDHRVEAAHDTGEGNWFLRVGYDEIFGRELAVDTVESFQSLASAGLADDQLASFKQIEIENVGGLSTLPENVIRCIDGIADRALVEQCKA